jgi:hypothetical protein
MITDRNENISYYGKIITIFTANNKYCGSLEEVNSELQFVSMNTSFGKKFYIDFSKIEGFFFDDDQKIKDELPAPNSGISRK